ncbi:MAG: histidine phosphatase family protein [Gemmatimonadetes bacterium]|nr:histidine phosphatase family protein [Gemmatimonadota bacterium]
MKTVMLLRHAKSSWDDASLPDFQRPLAERGHDAAPRLGEYMANEGLRPDAVLCSGARRAVETWEHIAPLLNVERVQVDDTLYMASGDAVLAWLRNLPDTIGSVLLIGHNPGFEELARRLVGDGRKKALKRMRKKYPTGALAVLTFDGDAWSALGDGGGYLDRFVRPKDV